jgi:hypothetical protein
MVQPAAL